MKRTIKTILAGFGAYFLAIVASDLYNEARTVKGEVVDTGPVTTTDTHFETNPKD